MAKTEKLLPIAAAVALGLLGLAMFYRMTLASGGDLVPGTDIDSRFNLVVMEHWYRVATFRESPGSVGFFHPVAGVLGMSDSMLLFSVPYIPMRLVGFDPFSAFRNTLILISALGYAGAVLFMRRTLGLHWLAAIPMSAVFAFSSHLYVTMFHPQMLAVAVLPFLAMALWQWKRYGRHFIVLLTLTALTTGPVAWAVGFWLVLAALSALVLFATRDGWADTYKALTLQPGLRRLAWTVLACAVPVAGIYWGLSAHRTAAPWLAVRPTLGREVVNFTGISVIASWCAGTVWALVRFYRRRDATAGAIAILGISSAIGVALALEYPGSFQPWKYIHAYVPGGGLFRVVFRMIIVLTFGICVTAAAFLSRVIEQPGKLPRPAAYLVVAALCAHGLWAQVRESGLTFSIQAQRTRLESVPLPPAVCTSFFLNLPFDDLSATAAQIDAMLIAQQVNLPTLNGYSAGHPKGWELTGGMDYQAKVLKWSVQHGLTGVCGYDPPTRFWMTLR